MNSLAALLAAAAAQTASVPTPAAPPPSLPQGPALTEAILKADAELFELLFTGPCDPTRMRAMLADDLEFYHDKGGVVARSADEFVAVYAKNCAERQGPEAWRSRREPVRASIHVDPIPGHGAIEAGDHLFYERKGAGGAEKLAGRARFAQTWALGADGRWRLSRVLSFAHGPAE